MTIQLARYLPEQPFNTVFPRFHPEHWTIDYNALMVATIIPVNARGFRVPAQWRTNADFMGVRWESEDKYNHDYFKYATDNNYESTVLAFRANPSEPDKFTVTITAYDVPYTYRLCPYVLDAATNRYVPLDESYNPGTTFPADVIIPQDQWTEIPIAEMIPFKGRTDYVFILDFSDIRIFSRYDGPKIDPRNIAMISFDTVEWSHGLGRDATITSMEEEAGALRMRITGALPGAVLVPGDRLTYLARFRVPTNVFFGNPIAPKRSLPAGADDATKGPGFWPPATVRTHFFQDVGDIDQIEGTPATILISGYWQYFDENNPDPLATGWQEEKTWGPFPVTRMWQVSPGNVAVEYDCSSDPEWSDPQEVPIYKYIAGTYATVTYQNWGMESRENQAVVITATGFGTGEWNVLASGSMPGPFIACDAFYSRYLQTTAPVQVYNSNKYFLDFTVTGTRTLLARRDHPQPAHELMMTSGFDDGYNLTAARQVDQVYKLGYRGWWTKYQGMSHYFNGRTAWQDKITGEVIVPGRTNDMYVMFAGDHTIAAHFTLGRPPNRGADAFAQKAAGYFGVANGQVRPINGALSSTSADRAAAIDPSNPNLDLSGQTTGGLWWWDLEADAPGPALLNCINVANRDIPPRAVVWAQGIQDLQAIQYGADRTPRPTVARTQEAWRKVFAYMRSIWGADLPIIVQGLGWLWEPAAMMAPDGYPMYLAAARNSWGDVVFRWLSYKIDPRPFTWIIEIFDPVTPTQVLREITVAGTHIYDGTLVCDWPVEMNVPDSVASQGAAYPWTFLRWRVRRADNPETLRSAIQETFLPIDNNDFVKKVVALGINEFAGGYTTDLSDPLNPGTTGAEGRHDVVAAATMRRTLAQSLGLRDVEVMPVSLAVAASSLNPTPYAAGGGDDNYWWNPTTNAPGPNLLAAQSIVANLGRTPDYFIEASPHETQVIMDAPAGNRPGILAQMRTSNLAMLNWMRTNWSKPALEIWLQGATSSWFGDPPPTETNYEGAKLVRDAQTSLALENAGFKLGSYVPNGYDYNAFRNELGIGWFHYTVQTYHDVAAEMAVSIGTDRNMAENPPDWVGLQPPTGVHGVKLADRGNRMLWTARAGVTRWHYVNRRVDTGVTISEGFLSTNSYTFPLSEQVATYGFETNFMSFLVSEATAGDAIGPSTLYTGDVTAGSSLQALSGLQANGQTNDDVIFTWTSRPAWQNFYYRNKDVSTGATISEGPLTSPEFTFTRADQVAHYGFPVTNVSYDVYEYDPATGEVGPVASFSGAVTPPVTPFYPITGFTATAQGAIGDSDVLFNWDDSPTAGRKYKVVNKRVDTAAVISTTIVSVSQMMFTKAEQQAVYGFAVSYVNVDVCEHDDVAGTDGPVFNYNGAVS